ncbi:MAG: hypothetical protein M0R68_03945 [Bacteroidetes bacterium]|nr:hypothetical protein [Bacteroidota bacterium]
MARRKTEDGVELVPGSAAESLYLAEQAKRAQQAAAPAQTGVNVYWGGTTSDQSRAADAKEWQDKLDRIAEEKKTRESARLTERAQDIESAKTDATTAATAAVNAAKNKTTLEAARIKAGLDGTGTGTSAGLGGTRKGKSEKELIGNAALELMKVNPGFPGKPDTALTADEARRRASKLFADPAAAPALPGTTATGTPLTSTTPAVNTAPVDAGVTEDKFKQYGKTKGFKYQGLQAGIEDDQIGKFTDANGIARFANTGAVNNAVTDTPVVSNALTGALQPSASAQQLRSGLGVASTPVTAPMSIPSSTGGKRDFWTALGQQAIKAGDTIAEGASSAKQNFIDSLGPVDTQGSALPLMPAVPEAPIPATTLSPERADNLTAQGLSERPTEFGVPGYLNRLNAGKSSPTMPKGFLTWFNSLNKKRKSTNPLFPNYEQ